VERAGVSIGTLYQYFANKEAVLIEMVRAQLESDRIAITRALSKSISGAPAEPERLAMLQLRDGLSTSFQTEGRASAF
jgi:AcrR family transcriptional regulator